MKYLKTYENIDNPYKKYGVWEKDKPNYFYIIKILGKWGNKFKITTLNIFNEEKQIFTESPVGSRKNTIYEQYAKKHILFSSDDIEECKEKIILLSKANKFNL